MQNVVNSNSPENMLCYKQKYSIQNILLKPDRQSIVDCDNNALVRIVGHCPGSNYVNGHCVVLLLADIHLCRGIR